MKRTEFGDQIAALASVLAGCDYGRRTRGDGATRSFLRRLLSGPVAVTAARLMDANLQDRARSYLEKRGLRLTVLHHRGNDVYYLAMRRERRKPCSGP